MTRFHASAWARVGAACPRVLDGSSKDMHGVFQTSTPKLFAKSLGRQRVQGTTAFIRAMSLRVSDATSVAMMF